jgi:hypothetical protein
MKDLGMNISPVRLVFQLVFNNIMGAKVLGWGATIYSKDLNGYRDPFFIDGYRFNPADERWYGQAPSPYFGQFAWEKPASPERQIELTKTRNFVLFENTLERRIADRPRSLWEDIKRFWDLAQRFAPRADPLVLDLDGDGLETLGLNLASPVYFDHNADGIKTGTGWVKSDDAFLVLDRNGNGTIDDGRELFGDATPLNGKGTLDTSAGIAAEGFAALAKEDTNVPRFGREWHEHRRERSGTDVELPLNFLYGLGHPPKKHEAGTVRCGVIRPVMPTP